MIYEREYNRTNLEIWVQQIRNDGNQYKLFSNLQHPESMLAHMYSHYKQIMKSTESDWISIIKLEKCLPNQTYKKLEQHYDFRMYHASDMIDEIHRFKMLLTLYDDINEQRWMSGLEWEYEYLEAWNSAHLSYLTNISKLWDILFSFTEMRKRTGFHKRHIVIHFQRKHIGPIVIKSSLFRNVLLDIFQRAHLNKHIDKDKESYLPSQLVIQNTFQRHRLNKNIDKFEPINLNEITPFINMIKSILQRKCIGNHQRKQIGTHQRNIIHKTISTKIGHLHQLKILELKGNIRNKFGTITSPTKIVFENIFLDREVPSEMEVLSNLVPTELGNEILIKHLGQSKYTNPSLKEFTSTKIIKDGTKSSPAIHKTNHKNTGGTQYYDHTHDSDTNNTSNTNSIHMVISVINTHHQQPGTNTCEKFAPWKDSEFRPTCWTPPFGGELILSFTKEPKHGLAVHCYTGGMTYIFQAKMKLIDEETRKPFFFNKQKLWICDDGEKEQNKEDDDISTSIFFREMSHYKDDEEFLELYDPQYHSSHGDDLKVNGNSHFNANESDNIVAQNVIVWLRHLLQKLFWTKPVMQNSLMLSPTSTLFNIDEQLVNTAKNYFYLGRIKAGVSVVVDKVSINRASSLSNHNAEVEDINRLYQHGDGKISIAQGAANEGPNKFTSTGLLTLGSKYSADNYKPNLCDKNAAFGTKNSCPYFTLATTIPIGQSDWIPNEFKHFQPKFEVANKLFSATEVRFTKYENNLSTGQVFPELNNLNNSVNIVALAILDDRSNELTGKIIHELSDLASLQIVDMSDINTTDISKILYQLQSYDPRENNINCLEYYGPDEEEYDTTIIGTATCFNMGCTTIRLPKCNTQFALDSTTCFAREKQMSAQWELANDSKTWQTTWEIGCYTFTLSGIGNDGIYCTEILNLSKSSISKSDLHDIEHTLYHLQSAIDTVTLKHDLGLVKHASLISDLNDEIIQLQRLRSQPAEIKAKCIENNPFSVENSPSSSRKSNKQHFVKFDLEQYYSKLADKNSKPTDSENTVSNSTVERKLQNTTINQTNSHRRCNELLILSASNYFNNFEYDAELDAMLTVLQTLSSRTSLTHHDTTQYKAACRILFDDMLNPTPDMTFMQRYITAVLLYAINPNELNLLPLNTCDHEVVTCNDETQNTMVELRNTAGVEGVAKTILSKIFNLHHLENLSLENNELIENLPSNISKLINLCVINLDLNDLTRTLSSQIGKLQNLTVLRLAWNNFDGSFPSAIGHYKQLERIDMTENNMGDTIPKELFDCGRLKVWDFYLIGFTGTIPTESSHLQDFWLLKLNSNNFSVKIPSKIDQFPSLQQMWLAFNDLIGTLLEEIGNISSLTWLVANNKNLTGTIPDALEKLTLKVLQLSINEFTGIIPSVFWYGDYFALLVQENEVHQTVPDDFFSRVTHIQLDDSPWFICEPKVCCSCCEKSTYYLWDNNERTVQGTKQPNCPSHNRYNISYYEAYWSTDHTANTEVYDFHGYSSFIDIEVCLSPLGCYSLRDDPILSIMDYDLNYSESSNVLSKQDLKNDNFNEFFGKIVASVELATATDVYFYFERTAPGVYIILDNVKIKDLVTEADKNYQHMIQSCTTFVLNGNVEHPYRNADALVEFHEVDTVHIVTEKLPLRSLENIVCGNINRNYHTFDSSRSKSPFNETAFLLHILNAPFRNASRTNLSPMINMVFSVLLIIHDRKQPHNKEYVSLISLANQCTLDLVMKLSEAQQRPFYTGLSESEEQNLYSSIERRFPFWKMSIALSMHLKHQLSAAHRYDKFDSHKNWKMLRALQLILLFLKSTLKTDAFKGGNWTRVDNNQRYYLNLSPFTKLLKLALDENRDKINILRYNKYYDKDTTLGRKRNYNNSADTFTKALPRTLFYKHSVISWDVYHHLITKEVCQYVPKTQTRLS